LFVQFSDCRLWRIDSSTVDSLHYATLWDLDSTAVLKQAYSDTNSWDATRRWVDSVVTARKFKWQVSGEGSTRQTDSIRYVGGTNGMEVARSGNTVEYRMPTSATPTFASGDYTVGMNMTFLGTYSMPYTTDDYSVAPFGMTGGLKHVMGSDGEAPRWTIIKPGYGVDTVWSGTDSILTVVADTAEMATAYRLHKRVDSLGVVKLDKVSGLTAQRLMWTGAGGDVRASDGFVVDTGKTRIGVGTTTPQHSVSVVGAANTTGANWVASDINTTRTDSAQATDSSSISWRFTRSGKPVFYARNPDGSIAFCYDSARFGINVQPTTREFDLVGSVFQGTRYNNTAGNNFAGLFRRARGTTPATAAVVQSDDALGAFQFEGYDGTNFVASAVIRSRVDSTVNTNVMPGNLVFLTNPGGSSTSLVERFRISRSGNIGINTTSFGTGALRVLSVGNAVAAPSTGITDGVELWSGDAAAGDANLYTMNEAGYSERLTGLLRVVTTQYDKTNTTLGNVTGLTFNVEAGKKYSFNAILYTTSDVAGGVQAAIAGTATATSIIYEGETHSGGTITQGRGTSLGTAVGAITAVTAATMYINGTITVNAAGTLTVQFAENAAVATSSVLVGSRFELRPGN
jgi:hypothetical protein